MRQSIRSGNGAIPDAGVFQQLKGMETDTMHLHGFYEIIWFQKGSGTHYVDFNQYAIAPGTIIFISPGQIHSFDTKHDQEGYVLKICAELFDDFVSLSCVTVQDKDSAALEMLIGAMQEELKRKIASGIGRLSYDGVLLSIQAFYYLVSSHKNSRQEFCSGGFQLCF